MERGAFVYEESLHTLRCVVQFRPCCQVWRLGPLDLAD